MNESALERLQTLAAERKQLDSICVNHPDIYACWEKIIDLLSRDLDLTCDLLRSCETTEIYWIREVFDDVSERLQSWKFIECIEQLQQQFPSVNMTIDIEYAIKAIKSKRD